jgi:hypothetical protein
MVANFLDTAGTGGFIQTVFNLQTTELNTLASGAAATSSVGGTAGVFTQTNWSNAIWGSAYFVSGGAFTPTSGGYLAGWFLLSPDAGSTFETLISTPSTTVLALGRVPDFVIPVYEGGTAWAATNQRASQGRFFKAPWESHKIVIQNLSGAALPASGNVVKAVGMAVQY